MRQRHKGEEPLILPNLFKTMEQELKVYIEKTPVGPINIYFVDKRNGRMAVAKKVELVFEEVDEAAMTDPTIQLSPFWGESLLQAFAEALDEKGVKTDKDAKIEGTLEATRYHLEDMRTIALNKSKK